jgi:hypothetical protein
MILPVEASGRRFSSTGSMSLANPLDPRLASKGAVALQLTAVTQHHDFAFYS